MKMAIAALLREAAAWLAATLWPAGFWASFWPNMVSTIIGIALGLRLTTYLDQRRRRYDEVERLTRGLELVTNAVRNNARNLFQAVETLKAGGVILELQIDD